MSPKLLISSFAKDDLHFLESVVVVVHSIDVHSINYISNQVFRLEEKKVLLMSLIKNGG